MKSFKGVNFFLLIIVFVLGKRLIEHFDPVTKTFSKPAIDILYGVVLLLSVFFLIRDLSVGRRKASAEK